MSEQDNTAPEPSQADAPPHILVQPAPLGFHLYTQPTPDGRKWVVLRLESINGSFKFPMDPSFAEKIGSALLQEAMGASGPGLIIPQANLPKDFGGDHK